MDSYMKRRMAAKRAAIKCMPVLARTYFIKDRFRCTEYNSMTGFYEGHGSDHLKGVVDMLADYDWGRERRVRSVITECGSYTARQAGMMLANSRTTKLYPEYIEEPEFVRHSSKNARTLLQVISLKCLKEAREIFDPDEFRMLIAENVLIEVDETFGSTEDMYFALNDILYLCPNVMVYIPKDKMERSLKNNLRFEGWRIVEVKDPEIEDYIKDIRSCAGEFGVTLEEDFDPAKAVKTLMDYRQNEFREDDIAYIFGSFSSKKTDEIDIPMSMEDFYSMLPGCKEAV